MKLFNKYRTIALFLMLIAATTAWYSVILLINPVGKKPIPDRNQLYGLVIVLFVTIGGWFSDCLTLKTH